MAQHRTSDTNIKTHRSPSSHGSASDPEEAGGGVRQRVVAESSQVLARHGIFLKQIVVGAWLHCCDLQRATTRWARRTRRRSHRSGARLLPGVRVGAYAREWVMLPNDHARNPTHTMPPTRVQLAGRAFCYSRLECGSTSHHHKVATISAPPTPIIKLQCARTSKHVPSRHPLLGLRSTFPTLTGDSSTKSSVWAGGSDRLPGGGHRACSPRRGPVPLLQLCRRRPRWKVAGCMGVFIAPSSRWRATWI